MKKSALVAVAVALMSVMAPLPAEAQYRHGFNNWDGNRNHGYVNRWDGNNRYRYYNRYRPYGGFGFGLGAGIFGFALGSALANSYSNQYRVYGGYDHVARCEARYRSYDAGTDMYLGYDGNYHRCRL